MLPAPERGEGLSIAGAQAGSELPPLSFLYISTNTYLAEIPQTQRRYEMLCVSKPGGWCPVLPLNRTQSVSQDSGCGEGAGGRERTLPVKLRARRGSSLSPENLTFPVFPVGKLGFRGVTLQGLTGGERLGQDVKQSLSEAVCPNFLKALNVGMKVWAGKMVPP